MAYFKREPLLPEEANRLANACEGDEALVVWTLLDTGLRASELAGLTRDNIDWQNRRLVIHGKGEGKVPGEKKRRVVWVPDRAWRLLEAHFTIHKEFGMHRTTIHKKVKRVANRAGISRNCSPHILRHTFAVEALRKGISLRALQEQMGHSSIQTTMEYLNLSPEHVIAEFKEKW